MVKKKQQEDERKRDKGFEPLGQIMLNYDVDNSGKYISQEFQDFGYRMALELDDRKNVAMYMRLSKTIDRLILESALSFVRDAKNVKSKSALFLWKMKQIKIGKVTQK